jgi:hypothetical protein
MDRDNGVGAIVLPAEHLLGLGGFDLSLVGTEIPFEIGSDLLAGLGKLDEHAEVVAAPFQRDEQRLIVFEPAPALHDLLRARLVVPESRFFYLAIDIGKLVFELRALKDTSAVPPRVG